MDIILQLGNLKQNHLSCHFSLVKTFHCSQFHKLEKINCTGEMAQQVEVGAMEV